MDIPFIYSSYSLHIFTAPDLSETAFQTDLKGGSGAISLDLELLKQMLSLRVNMRGHRFHNMDAQVYSQSLSQGYTRDHQYVIPRISTGMTY